MNTRQAEHSYTVTAKILHWLMAVLWIVIWGVGFTAVHWREVYNHNFQLTFLHKALASTILFLTILRIIWRLGHTPPAWPATMSASMKRAAHAGHSIIYMVALIALPLSGWYWSSVANKPISMMGFIHIPFLVAPDPSLYLPAKWIHTVIAWACGVIISGHIIVALKHHFIDKDSIVQQMLFTRRH